MQNVFFFVFDQYNAKGIARGKPSNIIILVSIKENWCYWMDSRLNHNIYSPAFNVREVATAFLFHCWCTLQATFTSF